MQHRKIIAMSLNFYTFYARLIFTPAKNKRSDAFYLHSGRDRVNAPIIFCVFRPLSVFSIVVGRFFFVHEQKCACNFLCAIFVFITADKLNFFTDVRFNIFFVGTVISPLSRISIRLHKIPCRLIDFLNRIQV